MRRLFCLFLTLLLLTAPALSEVSGNLLGLSLLADMTDGTQNAAVSPLSLQMALSLAREGAAGETRAELDALLAGDAIDTEALLDNARYADMYEVVTEEDVLAELGALLAGEAIDIEVLLAGIFAAPSVPGLRAANAGFVDPEVELLPDYVSRVDAEWFPLDADPANINAWASKHTDGLIDRILTAPLSPDTVLCLVNALAMEARWECALTRTTHTGASSTPGQRRGNGPDVSGTRLLLRRARRRAARAPALSGHVAGHVRRPPRGRRHAIGPAGARAGGHGVL